MRWLPARGGLLRADMTVVFHPGCRDRDGYLSLPGPDHVPLAGAEGATSPSSLRGEWLSEKCVFSRLGSWLAKGPVAGTVVHFKTCE